MPAKKYRVKLTETERQEFKELEEKTVAWRPNPV
jgi:hypothetical protein